MTIKQAINTVRIALGDRNEHHPNCGSKTVTDGQEGYCDCYAKRRQFPHKAMDLIEKVIIELEEDANHG